MPSGLTPIPKRRSVTVRQAYPLELPSICKVHRIDLSGVYRWRIEYFTNKNDVTEYQRTREHSGKAISVVSSPFVIPQYQKPGK
jgi:hypothetical protein